MAGITIRGLSKNFGANAEVAAVSDITLDIADNSFVTLLGPSGCGKTTTLRLIAGYIVPDEGTIEVDGRTVSSASAVVSPESRGMGMVFQNYAIWPHKTVFENVVFGLKLRKVPAADAKKKVSDTLALVNLAGLDQRYPNELSGGQQQRVALARSLVVEPEILLLDEPLSNLDAKLRERMRTELKELQRRTGITFVYVTHDQAEALALSDRIAVMQLGKVQQFGTPLEVYTRPANRMVADFMGLVNLVPGKVRDVRNGAGTIELAGDLAVEVSSLDGAAVGEGVDVSVRPENIRLSPPSATPAARAKITSHVFLGNISEYYAALPSGQVLRVQTHPLQHFEVGTDVAVEIDAKSCSVFRRHSKRSQTMNKPVTPSSAIRGEEHWTNKGNDVKLFMWEKYAGDPAQTRGTILFVHGSSMASQPTFDLQVPGRNEFSAMDFFAARGFDTWCVDMEGYGRSTKTRDNNAPISYGADDCFEAATYIEKLRGKRPLLVYGISSGALRAALFAERHPEMVGRLALDAMVWTGEGSPTLADRRKRLPEYQTKNRRPIDRAFVHSIFTRDHPGTADDDVVEAFADAILKLDDSVPTGTYVDMCARLPVCNPEKIKAATIIMRGQFDGIASLEDLVKFFEKLPNPDKQFVVMPGIAHASLQQKNHTLVKHILLSFFTQPEPIYRSDH